MRRFIRQEMGFTLTEMVVTIALMTILLSMAAGAMSWYFAGRSLDIAAREVMTEMREAQTMAVSTGNIYRIDFSGDSTYQVLRRQSGDWANSGAPINLPSGVHINSSSFGGDHDVDFYARGASEDGQVVFEGRFGMTKTVRVDGETVNVRVTG